LMPDPKILSSGGMAILGVDERGFFFLYHLKRLHLTLVCMISICTMS
jgi:hypothetical protein